MQATAEQNQPTVINWLGFGKVKEWPLSNPLDGGIENGTASLEITGLE